MSIEIDHCKLVCSKCDAVITGIDFLTNKDWDYDEGEAGLHHKCGAGVSTATLLINDEEASDEQENEFTTTYRELLKKAPENS